MRVIVTRPQPDAARTAERLAAMGYEAIVDSLLTLEPAAAKEIPAGRFAALAATSANAVRVAGAMVELDRLRSIPLYVVGAHTGEAARDAGFHNVTSADGDAAALAKMLSRRVGGGSRVLHLAGEERAQDLGALLASARIEVVLLVLYRMRAATSFGAAASAIASGEVGAVLHYSLRSAAIFLALAEQQDLVNAVLKWRHLCLSQAVAAPLIAAGATVEIAPQPNESALVSLLG